MRDKKQLIKSHLNQPFTPLLLHSQRAILTFGARTHSQRSRLLILVHLFYFGVKCLCAQGQRLPPPPPAGAS